MLVSLQLRPDTSKLESFVSSKLENYIIQFSIPNITVEDTLRLIENLPSGKATGPGDISARVLKLVAPVFLLSSIKAIQPVLGERIFP